MVRRVGAAWALALVSAAVLTGAAHAAIPSSTPPRVSDPTPREGWPAVPQDNRMHGGTTEWWYWHVIDPKTKLQYVGGLVNKPSTWHFGMLQYGRQKQVVAIDRRAPIPVSMSRAIKPANDGLPGVRTPGARLDYDPVANTWHLKVTTGFQADIWFDGWLPGVTGTIPLGQRRWMGWTSAVVTSTARGWIKPPGGKRIDVSGWRGYTDHNWGPFNMFDNSTGGWEWGVVHEPNGGAKVLGGVVTRDGTYIGTAADIQPGQKPKGCASTYMEQSDFYSGSNYFTGQTFAMPGKVHVRCASLLSGFEGTEFTMNLLTPGVADGGIVAATLEAQYATVPGSIGMYEHVRTMLGRWNAFLHQRNAK